MDVKKEGPPQPVLYHSWFWSGTHMSLIYNHIWLLADLPDRKGDAGNHSSRTDLRSGRVHINLIYNHIWFWVLGPLGVRASADGGPLETGLSANSVMLPVPDTGPHYPMVRTPERKC